MTAIALRTLRLLPMRWSQFLPFLVLAFGIPIALRQLQVIAAVGSDFWAMDVKASLVHRIPALGLLIHAPPREVMTRAYAEHHIIKWPGQGEFTPLRWLARIALAYVNVLGPPFAVVVVVWAAAAFALRRRQLRTAVRAGGRVPVAAFGLSAGFAIGTLATFVLFPEYFTAFYAVLIMPLVAHWVVIVLALVLYLLVAYRHATVRWAGRAVPVGALLLTAFLVWRIGTEVRNYIALPPRPYPGRQALEALNGHSAVTFWISSAVSTYTRQWAATLNDARWRFIRPDDLPFDPDRDYYFFMEADSRNPRYRRPEFLFIPRLNVPVLDNRVCRPLRGRIQALADGCSDLEVMARRFTWLPLYRRSEDFLLYDLRDAYPSNSDTGQARFPRIR